MKDGQKVKADGKPWQGPCELRNLRWEGGEYARQTTTGTALNPDEFKKNFDDAIEKSLEEERPNRLERNPPPFDPNPATE